MTDTEMLNFLGQCGILPQRVMLRDRQVVQLLFPPDIKLQQLIKKEGALWSSTLRAWYIDCKKPILIRMTRRIAAFRNLAVERPEITALRRQIRLKGYSPNTERAYVQLLEQFLDNHYPRRPEEISKLEIEDYLLHLTRILPGLQAQRHFPV